MEEIENMNFSVNTAVQQMPNDISADSMTITELREALMMGYREMEKGKVQEAKAAFTKFRERHSCGIK